MEPVSSPTAESVKKAPTPAPAEQAPQTLTAEEAAAKRTRFIMIGGAILLVVLLVGAIVLMAVFDEATPVIRDIAIVLVAVETFLIGLAVLLLVFQLQVLIQVLRDEVQPLLHSVNDTASTVRGTTEFVSHNLVSPIIKAAGFTAGVRQVLSDLIGVLGAARPHSRSKREE